MRGSITKRGKNRYLIRFFAGRDPVTGKQNRPTRVFHGSRKEAEKALRDWVSSYENGTYNPQRKFTLNEHLEMWREKILPSEVSVQTAEFYGYDIDRFVTDRLGRLPIAKIRPVDIQKFYLQLVSEGYGPSSIKRLHAALSKAFSHALTLQLIAYVPTTGVVIPGKDKIKKRPPKPMTAAEASAFLEAALETEFSAMFDLALASGMRPQEYLGLAWPAVEFDERRVRVEQAVKRPRGKNAPYIGVTKTVAGRRSIALPEKVMTGLRDHRTAQKVHQLQSERWNTKLDLVFPEDFGELWNWSNFEKAFKEVQSLAGLKGFTAYSLRHTCATLLLLAGENPKIVAERLGHASIQITLDTYSHVLPNMQRGASDKLNELLFGSA